MSDEERVKRVEEAIVLMKDLLISHENRLDNYDQRLDDYYKAMRESREDFEFKLNALIDAQLRNETEIAELKESSRELNEASQSQLKRIENLENK